MSGGMHQADETRRRRLRWRVRRGLLENDLLMERFFDRFETDLGDADVVGLDRLLDLADGELLELILGGRELDGDAATPEAQRVLAMLRSV